MRKNFNWQAFIDIDCNFVHMQVVISWELFLRAMKQKTALQVDIVVLLMLLTKSLIYLA